MHVTLEQPTGARLITAGQEIALIHAAHDGAAEACVAAVAAAYRIGPERPEDAPIVLDVIA